MMAALCLAAAATAAVTVPLPEGRFMLAWTHSIEKIEWQEDWQVESNRLVPGEARIKGSGAGMEPPPQARRQGGGFRWQPTLPPQASVILARSDAVADHRLCIGGTCRPLSRYIGGNGPVTMTACRAP